MRERERDRINEWTTERLRRKKKENEQNEQVFDRLPTLKGTTIAIWNYYCMFMWVRVMRNGNLFKHLAASPWEIIKINKVLSPFPFLCSIAILHAQTVFRCVIYYYIHRMLMPLLMVVKYLLRYCFPFATAYLHNFNSIQFTSHWFAVRPLLRFVWSI